MLYGYPVEATQDNWLHDCICATIQNVHDHIVKGTSFQEWTELLPQLPNATRARLAKRDRTLGKYLGEYYDALKKLPASSRSAVLDALNDALKVQNEVGALLQDPNACCPTLTELQLPEPICTVVNQIFEFAFEKLLVDFKIRDKHYQRIYKDTPDKVCPFCGISHFKEPGRIREDYDHYLPESLYPFAGSNLRNLVPMCHDCNWGYKGSKDILRDTIGKRRKAFDPYNIVAAPKVSLDRSVPFEGANEKPQWSVDFDTASMEVQTWDDVFQIRARYIDHLNNSYEPWLAQFQKFGRQRFAVPSTNAAIIHILRDFEELMVCGGLPDRAFLKAAVFRMLRLHCENGHSRLLDSLRLLLFPT